MIRRESERLTHLINNVLDLGRIDAGTKRYAFKRENLAVTVREALGAYRPLFDRLGFRIESHLPSDPVTVTMDRDAIVQALINLFQNVIKYSGDRQHVSVSLEVDRDWARVSVTDRGIGIAPAEIPKIFEPYYRIPTDRSSTAPGSGLGLSLVKHAVEAHGGRIDVRSTPGEGSVFTLLLPLEGTPARTSTAVPSRANG